ncbi:MAG: hypothetical protein V5B34_19120 [Accumulibacter sp.]|jgi:hypothetical protein
MSLLSNLRERRAERVATAISAISATQPKGGAATVARIATVAVANPKEAKTALPAKVSPGDTATASYCWLIHFADRDPLEVCFSPEAGHAEVLDTYPSALAAEPIEASRRQPATMLTGKKETAVVAWLAQIGESDEAIVGEVLAQCRHDADARQYFLGRAGACAISGS